MSGVNNTITTTMKKLMNILLAAAAPLLLCHCATTVASHVPAARGTPTGDIRVDLLTQVSTQSRIVPVTPTCAPGRAALAAAPRQYTTSPEGIVVSTNRLAPVEGYEKVGSGTGQLLQGAGVMTLGVGAVAGKLGTRVNNSSYSKSSSSSTSGVTLGGCNDGPYIYGY